MAGIYTDQDATEKYFVGESGQKLKQTIQQNYKERLAGELGTPSAQITTPPWDWNTWESKAYDKNSPPPDLLHFPVPGQLYSTKILSMITGQRENDPITGLPVPDIKYFMEGSDTYNNIIASGKGGEIRTVDNFKSNWKPTGEVDKKTGEPLYSGNVVDRRNRVIGFEDVTISQINRAFYGWESGHQDRERHGLPDQLEGFSDPENPIRWKRTSDPKIGDGTIDGWYVGAPYYYENTPMYGTLLTVLPHGYRSHYVLQPNALGVPTEYPVPVGDMLTAKMLRKTGGAWVWDMGPAAAEGALWLVNTLGKNIDTGWVIARQNAWVAKHLDKSVQYTIGADGRPEVKDSLTDPMARRLWYTENAKLNNLDEGELKNPPGWLLSDEITSIRDIVAMGYSANLMAASLTTDPTINDVLMGRANFGEDNLLEFLNNHDADLSVRMQEDVIGAVSSFRIMDRVLGKLIGFGLPRGRELKKRIETDARGIFQKEMDAGDVVFAVDKSNKAIKQTWDEIGEYSQEIYFRRALGEYLDKNFSSRLYGRLVKWLDKGRIAGALDEAGYNAFSNLTASSGAIGGLLFSEYFTFGSIGLPQDKGYSEIVPYLTGAFLFGIVTPGIASSPWYQRSGPGSATFRDPTLMTLGISTATANVIDLGVGILSGPQAMLKTLKRMFSKPEDGLSPIALEATIAEIAGQIPDVTIRSSSGKNSMITWGQKLQLAEWMMHARANAIKTGTVGDLINEIDAGEKFFDALKNHTSKEFREKYAQVLTDIHGLVHLKVLDKMAGHTIGLGFNVNAWRITQGYSNLVSSRKATIELLKKLQPLINSLPDDEKAYTVLRKHLLNMRDYTKKRLNEQAHEAQEWLLVGEAHRELYSTTNYADTIRNFQNKIQYLELEVELKKLIGEDPVEITRHVARLRKELNENVSSIVFHLGENSKQFNNPKAGRMFSDLNESVGIDREILKNSLYGDLKKTLNETPVILDSLYKSLHKTFIRPHFLDPQLANNDTRLIVDTIGEAVDIQLNHALRQHAEMRLPSDAGETAITDMVNKHRERIAAAMGEGQTLLDPRDYTKMYGLFLGQGAAAKRVQNALRIYAPMTLQGDGFIIPGKVALDMHQQLSAGIRKFGSNKDPQYLAYRKALDELERSLAKNDPEALKRIKRTGEIYATHYHESINGEWEQTFGKIRLKRKNGKIVYDTPSSEWLDKIVDMIFEGQGEKVADLLNGRFGQAIEIKAPGYQGLGHNSIANIGEGSTKWERRIVNPKSAALLSSLIDWKMTERIGSAKKMSDLIKNPIADLDKIPDFDVNYLAKVLDNIRHFSDEMKLTAGAQYEVLDSLNYQQGILHTITPDEANLDFSSLTSLHFTDKLFKMELRSNPDLRRRWKKWNDDAAIATKGAKADVQVKADEVRNAAKHFDRIMTSIVGGPSQAFSWKTSYDFLTAEQGRFIPVYLEEVKKFNKRLPELIKSKAVPEGTKQIDGASFVRHIIRKRFHDVTSVKLTDDMGSFTTRVEGPSGAVRKDYLRAPLIDRIESEIDRLGSLLYHKDYGIFASKDHLKDWRAFMNHSVKTTSEQLGLKIKDWDSFAMPMLRFTDVPGQHSWQQTIANTMSFLRRVVSPIYLGAVAVTREYRMRKLGLWQALGSDPQMTKIFKKVMVDGDHKHATQLMEIMEQEHLYKKQLNPMLLRTFTQEWIDNEVNWHVDNNPKFLQTGPYDLTKPIDHPVNIKKSMENIEKEMDEIFLTPN